MLLRFSGACPLTDASGTLLERYHYTPYGQVTVLDDDFSSDADNTSDIGNTHLYTGRERDAETGLQLNRNRYYSWHVGRWTSRDPIGYLGGMNLYEYVGGKPTLWVDPQGLFWSSQSFGDVWAPKTDEELKNCATAAVVGAAVGTTCCLAGPALLKACIKKPPKPPTTPGPPYGGTTPQGGWMRYPCSKDPNLIPNRPIISNPGPTPPPEPWWPPWWFGSN